MLISLYLFLLYLPFTIISLTNYSILLSNIYNFSLIPMVSLFNNIVPYPVYYDIIALFGNYLILFIIKYIIYRKYFRLSNLVSLSLKFLASNFVLFVFLGFEYIYRFNNIIESIFGLFLLSLCYLYYPFLHRIYFGRNKNTWKRKIDYYYSYYKEGKQFSFIIDILINLLLGLMTFGWYYDIDNKKYLYLGSGLLLIIHEIFRPINYYNNRKNICYRIINIIFVILNIFLVFLDDKINFNFIHMVIGIFQLILNILFLWVNPLHQIKYLIRNSISLPDLYFDSYEQ